MKTLRPWVTLLLALVPATPAATARENTPSTVAHEVHDGYFVSNRFEPDSPVSFVVVADQAAFDRVFGVARVMRDPSHRLVPDAFATKRVLAAIHRGKAMVTYQVESVALDRDELVLRYTTRSQASPSAEFACPLIVSVPNDRGQSVRFVENGKEVHRTGFGAASAWRIECRKPGTLTAATDQAQTVLHIKGGGIGKATITRGAAEWPRVLLVRAHLGGLESLVIGNDREELRISVLSHSGHQTLLRQGVGGREGPAVTKDSPLWTEVRRLGPDGKPVAGLPPKDGCFELAVPQTLLRDAKTLRLEWIDFFRG